MPRHWSDEGNLWIECILPEKLFDFPSFAETSRSTLEIPSIRTDDGPDSYRTMIVYCNNGETLMRDAVLVVEQCSDIIRFARLYSIPGHLWIRALRLCLAILGARDFCYLYNHSSFIALATLDVILQNDIGDSDDHEIIRKTFNHVTWKSKYQLTLSDLKWLSDLLMLRFADYLLDDPIMAWIRSSYCQCEQIIHGRIQTIYLRNTAQLFSNVTAPKPDWRARGRKYQYLTIPNQLLYFKELTQAMEHIRLLAAPTDEIMHRVWPSVRNLLDTSYGLINPVCNCTDQLVHQVGSLEHQYSWKSHVESIALKNQQIYESSHLPTMKFPPGWTWSPERWSWDELCKGKRKERDDCSSVVSDVVVQEGKVPKVELLHGIVIG